MEYMTQKDYQRIMIHILKKHAKLLKSLKEERLAAKLRVVT
jgi:hypothetical protein